MHHRSTVRLLIHATSFVLMFACNACQSGEPRNESAQQGATNSQPAPTASPSKAPEAAPLPRKEARSELNKQLFSELGLMLATEDRRKGECRERAKSEGVAGTRSRGRREGR